MSATESHLTSPRPPASGGGSPLGDFASGVAALRRSVVLSRHDDLLQLRFPADAGLATLGPRVATDLALREAQFRQALVLDEAGRPRVDLLVGVFRGTLHVLATGRDRADAIEALGAAAAVHEDHVVIGLDGPFAWELLGAWDTPTAIGLPYLAAYAPRDGRLVIRAGRCGEYGYLLLIPRAEADAVWSELRERVLAMGGAVVGPEVLAHASLENWVFDLHREGASDLDALELQLTWRLDLTKDAVGLDAIRAHRAAGLRRRITAIRAAGPVTVGDVVTHHDRPVGVVIAACPNLEGPGHRVIAALDAAVAHAGLDCRVGAHAGRTRSAPFVLNRSLFVNPQRHAWASRHEIELPPGLQWPTPTSS